MNSITPTELNFLRLLERTKRLTKENLNQNVWKVTAATKVLNNFILQLQDESHNSELLNVYRAQVVDLKLLAEAAKKETTEESLKVIEKIPRLFPDVQVKVGDSSDSSFSSDKSSESSEYNKESAAGIRASQQSIYRADLRKQLMSTKKYQDPNSADMGEDEKFLKNEKLEENMAKELFTMTRSLKTIMTAANDVIKEDNKNLVKMQKQVEDNTTALETESIRLAKHAYKCGFDCFRLFLFLAIFVTFISMVLVMRMFPKKAIS